MSRQPTTYPPKDQIGAGRAGILQNGTINFLSKNPCLFVSKRVKQKLSFFDRILKAQYPL